MISGYYSRKNFDCKKFGFFNFRAKFFWAGQLSTGIFFVFLLSNRKKFPETQIP